MRARNIKPGFYKNEELAECSFAARLLAPGLWMMADREGRLEDRPKRIKAELFPYDTFDVDALLVELVACGHIKRYEASDRRYIQIVKFTEHQQPHHMEIKSVIPAPEGFADKYSHDPIGVPTRRRIYERDSHRCVLCATTNALSIDHIVPITKGGTSDDDNLRTLCKSCNSSKGNRDDISLKRRKQVDVDMTSSQAHDDILVPHPTDSLLLIPDSSMGRETPPPTPKITLESIEVGCLTPEWYKEHTPQISALALQRQMEGFKDHYRANGGKQSNGNLIKDWPATWRQWLRRTVERGQQTQSHLPSRPAEKKTNVRTL